MRTIAYIDGFNLYYGSLKRTPYKWLDLCAYFDRTLPGDCQLQQVKYFTARVSASPNNKGAPVRQDVYLRALRTHCTSRVEVTEGRFSVKTVSAPLATPPHRMVNIIKTEEKGSDVNLAVELVNDAWLDAFDCAVVVSNDADLERALRVAKQQRKKKVYLFTPGAPQRKPLAVLTRWSHKQFDVVAADLAASQLPQTVNPGNLTRPRQW
jgi:hypothetical protein